MVSSPLPCSLTSSCVTFSSLTRCEFLSGWSQVLSFPLFSCYTCNGIYKLIFGHSFSFDGGLWLTKSKSTAACPTIHIFDKEIWWCLNCTVFLWELGRFCWIWNNANFPESLDLQKKRPRKTCIIIRLFSWSYVFIWPQKSTRTHSIYEQLPRGKKRTFSESLFLPRTDCSRRFSI